VTTWRRVVGDTNDTLVLQVLADGNPVDLTAVSAIEAHVALNGASAATLTAAVTTAATGIVTVTLGSWITTAAPGSWALEVQMTSAGVPHSWPEGTPDTIEVRAALG